MGHRRRLPGVQGKLPLERAVRSPPTPDVGAQMRSRLDQFSVGIFQTPPAFGIVERPPVSEHVADGRVDGTLHEVVGFLEAGYDFGVHAPQERKGSRMFRALELDPRPRVQAQVVVANPASPDVGHMMKVRVVPADCPSQASPRSSLGGTESRPD